MEVDRGGKGVEVEVEERGLEPACEDDGFLSVPRWIVSHDLGVECDVMRRELR